MKYTKSLMIEIYMFRNKACFNKSADFGRSSGFNSRQRMPRSLTSTVSPSGIGGLSVAVAICKTLVSNKSNKNLNDLID